MRRPAAACGRGEEHPVPIERLPQPGSKPPFHRGAANSTILADTLAFISKCRLATLRLVERYEYMGILRVLGLCLSTGLISSCASIAPAPNAAISATATAVRLPIHHQAITPTSNTGGFLEAHDRCVTLREPTGTLVPLWPAGTRVAERGVVLPDGTSLQFGRPARLWGRFVFDHDGSFRRSIADARIAIACGSRGFLVERAEPILILNTVADAATAADAVVLAQTMHVDFSAPDRDRFHSTLRVRVTEVLHGRSAAGDVMDVRIPVGQGQLTAHSAHLLSLKRGDQLLLFLSRGFYEKQARASGGEPLPKRTGAAFGLYRVTNGRIQQTGDLPMPHSIEELKRTMLGS